MSLEGWVKVVFREALARSPVTVMLVELINSVVPSPSSRDVMDDDSDARFPNSCNEVVEPYDDDFPSIGHLSDEEK